MNITLRYLKLNGLIALLLVCCITTAFAQNGTQLRDLLTDSGCEVACFLGIEPGVTTKEEVVIILDAQGVAYTAYPPSPYSPGLLFNVNALGQAPMIFPLIESPYDQVAITTDAELVHDIIISGTFQVTLSDVLEAFGPPSYVLRGLEYQLVYEDTRMTVKISDPSLEIAHIHLYSPFSFNQIHPDVATNFSNMLPCTEPSEICSIVTTKHPSSFAGPDQTVPDADSSGAESVTLDGSGSSDPDGTITAYSWSDDTGTPIATGPTPTVELPVGVHTLTLTVTDDDGLTASDEVVITVTSATGCIPPVTLRAV